MLAQVLWTDVLSTQSTSEPEVVKGIKESMTNATVLLEPCGAAQEMQKSGAGCLRTTGRWIRMRQHWHSALAAVGY